MRKSLLLLLLKFGNHGVVVKSAPTKNTSATPTTTTKTLQDPGVRSQAPVAIITGGTRGIGNGVATILASNGYDLLLTFNTNREAAEASKVRIQQLHPNCKIECVGGDLTLQETRDRVFACLDSKFCDPNGQSLLQVLVHSAGQYIGITSDNVEGLSADTVKFGDGSLIRRENDGIERTDLSSIQYYQRLYGDAWIDMCERSLQRMTRPEGGTIVGISSPSVNPAWYRPDRFYSAPGSGKTIMEYSMRIYAKVAAERSINVNVIVPGVVQTEAWDNMINYRHCDETTSAMLQRLVDQMVPLKRVTQPTDIGEVIAFLCSATGKLITGMTLPVDGGMHIN